MYGQELHRMMLLKGIRAGIGVSTVNKVWLDDSIEAAWGVISKRTGKTVNGVFIKTEDLQGDYTKI